VLSFPPVKPFFFQGPGKIKRLFPPGLAGQLEKMEGLRKIRPSNQTQGKPSQGAKFEKRALVSEELGRGFPGMAGE
jgi:hypothetical protein